MGMNFETFLQKMKEEIILRGNGMVKVRDAKVTKNNGVVYQGFSIIENEEKPAPTIYLETIYGYYKKGVSFMELADYIWKMYEENANRQVFCVEEFTKFDIAKKRIMYKIVNAERNENLLQEIPHILFLDLAIVFYYLLEDASILIRNEHVKDWGVDIQELFQLAKMNTPSELPFELSNIQELMHELLEKQIRNDVEHRIFDDSCDNAMQRENCIRDIMDEIENIQKKEEHLSGKSMMYVLSNKRRFLGAACILYPDVMRCFANLIDRNFYVLPSSVHEVILLPDMGECNPNVLRNMVMEVNETEVEEAEFLSDNVYYYNRNEDKMTICT